MAAATGAIWAAAVDWDDWGVWGGDWDGGDIDIDCDNCFNNRDFNGKYGETGVNTFAVNQHGIVYQIDLGPNTETIVNDIDRFNPDDSWEVVND